MLPRDPLWARQHVFQSGIRQDLNPDICSDEKVVRKVVEAIKDTFKKCLAILPVDQEIYGTSACSSNKFSYHITVDIVASKKCLFDGPETCRSLAREVVITGNSDRRYWFYERKEGSAMDQMLSKGLSVYCDASDKSKTYNSRKIKRE